MSRKTYEKLALILIRWYFLSVLLLVWINLLLVRIVLLLIRIVLGMSRKTYEKLAHVNGMFNVLEQQLIHSKDMALFRKRKAS
jgi:hypothetical protein